VSSTHEPHGHTRVPEPTWSDGLLEAGLGDPRMARLVGWPARIQRMVEVEAALGRALARSGVIPTEAAEAIERACDPTRIDLDALADQSAASSTPVIPLVRALTEGADELAASWLHHGATSQDIIDTAVVLQLRDALDHLEDLLLRVSDLCAALADTHRDTVMAGRTLGQQAVPITFGLKAARWLGALDRHVERLRSLRPTLLSVQLGGAAGTAAVYGQQSRVVVESLAEELDLTVPDLPWHAERDRIAELAGTLSGVAGTVGAVAFDLVLLAQTEIGEVRERAGTRPSSSAMPHKRNPTHAVAARAASRLALGELTVLTHTVADHEHERAAGAWQTEWVALPSALTRTSGALLRLHAALDGLEVDADRAQENLEQARGLTSAEALATVLSPALGRLDAQRLVGELAAMATTTSRDLSEVAAEHPQVQQVLDAAQLAAALDPRTSLTGIAELIDRALATHRRLRRHQPST
jgi:3-carboxy-cis,cis-muconate cycloisomerase